jgi:hypothetical protein
MNTTTCVVLTSGERLESPVDTDAGVMTDAGLIPWSEVAGYRVWHAATQRFMFIPV